MNRRMTTTTEPRTPDEALLERLEHDIITGAQAAKARTELIYRMTSAGVTKADIVRRINRVREMRLVEPLTYDAIAQTIRRRK